MSDEIAISASVKQQVSDISEMLSGLLSELQSLRKTVDSLYAENRSLNRNVDRLLKENRELRKRLEKYEKPPKASGSSSTPPTKESIKAEIGRRTKSLRAKSDKPVGGQIGHVGTTCKMVDTPEGIKEVSRSILTPYWLIAVVSTCAAATPSPPISVLVVCMQSPIALSASGYLPSSGLSCESNNL